MSLAVSIGPNTISLYLNGDYYSVDKTHANHAALLAALRKNPRDEEEILGLVELPKFISTLTSGRVEIGEEEILFRGQKVSGYMVDRLMEMAHAGDEVESWAAFMDNLMDNPLPTVREDLYRWMEAGKMPITPDGCIIAFKKVKSDYTDCHTGKFDNSVGAVLEMPREHCDTNRNNTCSTGFHFCSAGYLSHFHGQKVMVVKINPRDVTAIPTDYNNHKARCCRYTVTGELTKESAARHKVWTDKNVVNLENPQELPEVLMPRKGKSLAELDPARVNGPAPTDDLAPAKSSKKKKVAAKSNSGKKKPASKKVASKPEVALPEVEFTRSGKTFTATQIKAEVAKLGLTKAAGELGVPKSTLSGWLKKIQP